MAKNPFGMHASQRPGWVMFLKTTHRPLLIARGSCDAVGPAKSQAGCPGAVLVSVRPSVRLRPLAGLTQPSSLLSSSPAEIYWGQDVKPCCRCTFLGARRDFSPFSSPYNIGKRGPGGTSPPTAVIPQGTGGERVVRVWGTDPRLCLRGCQLSKCHPVPPGAGRGTWARPTWASHWCHLAPLHHLRPLRSLALGWLLVDPTKTEATPSRFGHPRVLLAVLSL